MTYCLSNKYTKNYCDRTILVQVIVEDVVAYFFFKHGVDLYGSLSNSVNKEAMLNRVIHLRPRKYLAHNLIRHGQK